VRILASPIFEYSRGHIGSVFPPALPGPPVIQLHMTFEEGLERLKERHEALTQTVELLAAENRQIAAENKERDKRLGQIMEGIARLLHVAEIHEHRLTRLEGGG